MPWLFHRMIRINKLSIMQGPNKWSQHSIHTHNKKVHSAPIISIHPHDPQLFFTSSEDHTARLWDIRLHSSVKLFRNPTLINLTNCQSDLKNILYVGSGQHVFSFDIRQESIFVQKILNQSQQPHFDDVSFIRVDPKDGRVAVSDDEGDVRVYNSQLQCTQLLDQGHNNIVNAVEFVDTQKGRLCVSGGFDCRLVHWNIENEEIVREIDLQELFTKLEIKASTMPFIYSIHQHKTTVIVTTETGHVLAYPLKDLKKHKYILQASLARVVQAKIPHFNQNLLITLSRQGSFSLFDHTKRHNNAPAFLQKYKCKQQPSWLQFMQNQILIANSKDPQLYFYTVK